MPLLPGPLSWLALRAVVGFGCAGLFTATESWLNAKAEPAQRGRVFSTYMFGTFVALALGQLLIGRTNIQAVTPFTPIGAHFSTPIDRVTASGRFDRSPSRQPWVGKICNIVWSLRG